MPLFATRDGATPFADGARFTWRDDNDPGDTQSVIYRRAGVSYRIHPVDDRGEEPMRVTFIAIPETPEDDYIAQVQLERSGQARVYAFLLPHGAGHRILSAPRALEAVAGGQVALDRHCSSRPNGECHVASRAALMALYHEVIYPQFVGGGATPDDFMEQTPARAASGRRK